MREIKLDGFVAIGDCSPFPKREGTAYAILEISRGRLREWATPRARSNARLGMPAKPPTVAGLVAMQTQKTDHSRSIGDELLRTIGLTALIVFGLGTLAMADEIVPAEYQGVWAAARNCNDNFQNIVSDVVNRKLAACRVTQVVSSGDPDSHTSIVSLNCGGLRSRELWHDESSDGADYLVIVQFGQGAAAGRRSIDLYKRCPEIPLGEIPLSDIPGNPIVSAAAEEKIAPPSPPRVLRQRPFPHPRATRVRKHRPQ